MPLKTVVASSVLVGDVGTAVTRSHSTNIVRVDGQTSVYLPMLKQGGDTNTIAVVDGDSRKRCAWLTDMPKQLSAKVVFDQSIFVKTAINTLLHEGAIGLVLTGGHGSAVSGQRAGHGRGLFVHSAFRVGRVPGHRRGGRHDQCHDAWVDWPWRFRA